MAARQGKQADKVGNARNMEVMSASYCEGVQDNAGDFEDESEVYLKICIRGLSQYL